MGFQYILVFVVTIGCSARHLDKGEIKHKLVKHKDDIYHFEITDGKIFMKGSTSKSQGLLTCELNHSHTEVSRLLKDGEIPHQHIGETEMGALIKRCILLNSKKKSRRQSQGNGSTRTQPTLDPFNQEIVQGKPFPGDLGTGKPSGAGSHFAIFPGTKWCGYENVANSMQDLGTANKTDACCRTHDHCPYYIDRFETKYHYTNDKPWTVSHCECDQHLFDCLKSVNTTTADDVGKLFFGLLDVQCFTFETGQYCAKQHWSKLWCEQKETGPMAVMQQFPHKWGDASDPQLVG